MAFCGHATIAAAVAIAERDGPGLLHFDTLTGPVAVRTSPTPAGLTATLTSVPTRTRPVQAAELEAALTALRWRGEDLDPRYPAHVAYAGNDHLILAVRDRALLAALDYDYPALDKLMAGQGWTTVHLVQAQNPVVFHARDPFLPVAWSKTPPPGPQPPPSADTCAPWPWWTSQPGSRSSKARTWAALAACSSISPPVTSAFR